MNIWNFKKWIIFWNEYYGFQNMNICFEVICEPRDLAAPPPPPLQAEEFLKSTFFLGNNQLLLDCVNPRKIMEPNFTPNKFACGRFCLLSIRSLAALGQSSKNLSLICSVIQKRQGKSWQITQTRIPVGQKEPLIQWWQRCGLCLRVDICRDLRNLFLAA